jgi:glucokinase
MGKQTILVADIGGTNARLALATGETPDFQFEQRFLCRDFSSVEACITHYLASVNARAPDRICIAAAGPVVEDSVSFTNSDWRVCRESLVTKFATEQVVLLNDFEAIAYALPLLAQNQTIPIGSVAMRDSGADDCTLAVLGPGTGLGVAGLVRRQGRSIALVTEGGHSGFAPESALQEQVLTRLRTRFARVSDERLASGAGVENIYWALRVEEPAWDGQVPSAAEIFRRACEGRDLVAQRAMFLFFEILGQIAGNVALTLGAFQGVYLAGGIALRYPDILGASAFRTAFESKGRHSHLLASVPTALITHPNPGLLGALLVATTDHRLWSADRVR